MFGSNNHKTSCIEMELTLNYLFCFRTLLLDGQSTGHFPVTLCLGFKTSLRAKPCMKMTSYENEFDLHENEPVGGNIFM